MAGGSAEQGRQHQYQRVHEQLYADRAYWQFVWHANNDLVLLVVFSLILIHLLASVALILATLRRKVPMTRATHIRPSPVIISRGVARSKKCGVVVDTHGERGARAYNGVWVQSSRVVQGHGVTGQSP